MKPVFQQHIFRLIRAADRKVSPKTCSFRSPHPFHHTHPFHHRSAHLQFASAPSATNMEMIQNLDKGDLDPVSRRVFEGFKSNLGLPMSMEARRASIANDIVSFCETRGPDYHAGGVFLTVWSLMLHMVSCIPANHEWQEALASAVDTVRRREGYTGQGPEVCQPCKIKIKISNMANGKALLTVAVAQDLLWSDLPVLSMRLREHWENSTYHMDIFPAQDHGTNKNKEPFEGDENSPRTLSNWKNFNSFVSRLVASGFHEPVYLCIWELTSALENPAADAELMDCRVWVAAEWLIRCGRVLLDQINVTNRDRDIDANFQDPGPLYGEDQPPRSLQRWEFWKTRLGEIHAQSASIGLSSETKQHVEAALRAMGSKPRDAGRTGAVTQIPPFHYPPPEGDTIRKPRRVVTSQNNS